ncbi:HTTM domain-containing protein [Streptomyces sp. ST2-7A]|uniref:HTTM domain-containing protein n=1 Tax=Streptomyces sp. ST2-7A TaxID=2907214 RepID=UPI001F2A40E0|nr:HTTM domain-containing protein [Streptomyces sp. ST2-7A]MCE7083178.1 HTTM domain-containing protein [Streptomyces sp. ST2-7A]
MTHRTLDRLAAFFALLIERPISLYAAAVLRIGYGLLYLVFLLREFPHRDAIWGPGSPWTPALARQLFDQTGWASFLTLSDSRAYFELCYVLAVVTSALFMLGWRTRAMSVLFAVVVASFHSRAIFMTDGGDNLILLMSVYLAFTACGRRWSLDARRARSRSATGPGPGTRPSSTAGDELRSRLRDARVSVVTVLHNCGMFVIAAQVCFLYGSAGLYKVQGVTWGNGTALHYALNLHLFQPWPALSRMVDSHEVLITAVCYLTVLLQVAFPFVLFGRLKYPVLVMMLGMHVGIAVLMGLPLFSAAMIVADAVFLPDRFYRSLGLLGRRVARSAGGRRASPGPEPGLVPTQSGPVGEGRLEGHRALLPADRGLAGEGDPGYGRR